MKKINELVSLFFGEALLFAVKLKRYWPNTVGSLLVWTFIVFMVSAGYNKIAPEGIKLITLDEIMLYFILVILSAWVYTMISTLIVEEARVGTLEQLYMSPMGIKKVFFFRLFFQTLFAFLFIAMLLPLISLTTGKWLSLNLILTMPLILISLLSLYGIGFIFASLALVYKKIESIMGMASIGFFILPMLSGYPLNIKSILPFAPGANTVVNIIVNGYGFAHYPLWWYGFITLNSLIWLSLGLGVYFFTERYAKKKGILGQY